MARKWSNLNIPGALHYITGNFLNRQPVFKDSRCCRAFLDELRISEVAEQADHICSYA
jgi:hypothetical protein